MSGNIFDTNTIKLRSELKDLIQDLDELLLNDKPLIQYEDELKLKYPTIATTSKTLFKYLLNNYGTNRFNHAFFQSTIDLMLSKISQIQSSFDQENSQHNASVEIGTHLAQTFIPHLN